MRQKQTYIVFDVPVKGWSLTIMDLITIKKIILDIFNGLLPIETFQ